MHDQAIPDIQPRRDTSPSYMFRELSAAKTAAEGRDERRDFPRLGFTSMTTGAGVDTVVSAFIGALKLQGHNSRVYFTRLRHEDGSFYSELTKQSVYTLDPWLLDARSMHYLITKEADAVDFSILVGEVALFDSPFGGQSYEHEDVSYPSKGSHDQVARLTQTPQILVCDAHRFDVTKYAQLQGVLDYAQPSVIKGIILNRMNPDRYPELKRELEKRFDLKVYGYLPERPGLEPLDKRSEKDQKDLAETATSTLDLLGLTKLAQEAEPMMRVLPGRLIRAQRQFVRRPMTSRIAYPIDDIFRDRTQDNFDLLQEMGAELVPVSIQYDRRLPDDIQGMYFSGGLIKTAGDLSGNYEFRESFRKAVQRGLKVLVEGEAYRFLTRGIYDVNGDFAPMSAAWDVTIRESKDIPRNVLTYGRLQAHEPNLLGDRDLMINVAIPKKPWPNFGNDLRFDSVDDSTWHHGFSGSRVFATSARFHFLSHPECLVSFLEACRRETKHETPKRRSEGKPGFSIYPGVDPLA